MRNRRRCFPFRLFCSVEFGGVQSGGGKGFVTFGACAARAAMLFLPAVAGISAVIVDSKFHSSTHYVVFVRFV